jgi:antitoxin HicB
MAPAEYLKRPYGRVLVPEPDGTFRAEIVEFPGCIATGDTAAETLANLESVAESWLNATIAKGLRVPEPIESTGYSGKFVVRLPRSLHKKAAHAASREGVSLNQFIVSCIAEQVGARSRASEYVPFAQVTQPTGYYYLPIPLKGTRYSGAIGAQLTTAGTQLLSIPIALIQERQHA